MTATREAAVEPARGRAVFRPRARLIRLIGSELISDEIMAVVELVKNAYDADARTVVVELKDILTPKQGTLSIYDDGDGMGLETVLHSWLEPATNYKRKGGRKQRTTLGRYPLGEKGVGRFAADKLGDRMTLVTRGRSETVELVLTVAWDHFGDTSYLDEVETEWEQRRPLTFREHPHGTRIEVRDLRGDWDAGRVARLREGLSRLVSPSTLNRDFRIFLECPDFPELQREVTNNLVNAAPYQLNGEIDATGLFRESGESGEEVDLRLRAGNHFVMETGLRAPECGPVKVTFYAWDLDVMGATHAGLDRGTRAQLRRISGVSVYRDGFRVWPYGSPGDDWLELNQRRVNNPTMRLSTNQLVGVVEISQEANPNLLDRTSREGFITNLAVGDLQALVLGAVSILEERRFARRQSSLPGHFDGGMADPVLGMLQDLKARPDTAKGHATQLSRVIAAYRRQAGQHHATVDRLMRLAGTGISVEHVVAEIRRTIAVTSTGLDLAKSRTDRDDTPGEIRALVQQIDHQMAFLGRQLDVVAELAGSANDFDQDMTDLRGVFRDIRTIFAFKLAHVDAHYEGDQTGGLVCKVSRRDLLQVLVHLFDNAIYWAGHPPQGRPGVRVRLTEQPLGFIIADSGPGISGDIRDRVFDLHFSRRMDGRGLGLYLARTILEASGGSIVVLPDPVLLPGANLQVCLPAGSRTG